MKETSLEISKQLKEAGFPQITTFYHVQYSDDPQTNRSTLARHQDLSVEYKHPDKEHDGRRFAAPTAEEVLDQLPTNSSCNKGSSVWVVKYWWGEHPDPLREADSTTHWHAEKDKSLSEAAAKMWLYLKKEGLL